MDFDKWSEDAWYWLNYWWKALASLLTKPEQLVLNNSFASYLVGNSVPLAIALAVVIMLVAMGAMPFAFGRGKQLVVRAVGTVLGLVAMAIATAFWISPWVLSTVGPINGDILGDSATKLPFPYLGKGFWEGLTYWLSTGLVLFVFVMMISFATLIVLTGSLIVLSWVCRQLGKVGIKQWQVVASCFFTSHIGGFLMIAIVVRFGVEMVVGKTDHVFATFVIWVMLIIGLMLVCGMFYIAYELSTFLAGGRVQADSHSSGGDIDRIHDGGRSEPEVSVPDVQAKDATIQGDISTQGSSEVKVDEHSATSEGVEISLRRNGGVADAGKSSDSAPGVNTKPASSSPHPSPASTTVTNGGSPTVVTATGKGGEIDARADTTVSQSQTSNSYVERSGGNTDPLPSAPAPESSYDQQVIHSPISDPEVPRANETPWIDEKGQVSSEIYMREAYKELGLEDYEIGSPSDIESEVSHGSPDVDQPAVG